ncbi:GspH/FimT family pseudopilin [Luteibacter sp. Lutesp34]|uniref:GspH/FimT family pseudopilin n=1 Tax=Luteibacter sp. Lutesp34 TaxID=3243030 RepID=UPI0039B43006
MAPRRPPGFTLTELAAVLAIAGLAGVLALPAMGEALARYRLRVAADDLLDALNLARATALWRNRRVSVCPATDEMTCSPEADWITGWIVRDLEKTKIVAATPRLGQKLRVLRTPGRQEVTFTGRGAASATNQRIVLCVAARPATSLAVVVGNAGLVHRDPVRPHEAAACAAAPARQR